LVPRETHNQATSLAGGLINFKKELSILSSNIPRWDESSYKGRINGGKGHPLNQGSTLRGLD